MHISMHIYVINTHICICIHTHNILFCRLPNMFMDIHIVVYLSTYIYILHILYFMFYVTDFACYTTYTYVHICISC